MSDLLKQLERDRELEKIRGKATRPKRAKAPPKFLRPLQLKSRGFVYPLEEDPKHELNYDVRRFPKRIERRYVAVLGVVSGMGSYLGYLEAQPTGDWFWWKPNKGSAGAIASTLWEALVHIMPIETLEAELKPKVDELERIYRAEVPERTVPTYR